MREWIPIRVWCTYPHAQSKLRLGSPQRNLSQSVYTRADQAYSESLCKINVTGTLTKNITNATISFNVAPHFNDGRVGEIPGIDDFYSWVDVYQNHTRTRHLQPGPALMNQSFLLLGGWVPVANYSAVFNVTTPEGTLFRLCAEWEMKLRGTDTTRPELEYPFDE
ncbi:MAG: hypothetical protein Q9180_005476 [Flavoplaca navasiana]